MKTEIIKEEKMTNKCCETNEKSECCAESKESNNMPENTKEMVAVGISAAINCRPCLDYHVSAALKAGVSEQELSDIISLAQMIVEHASSSTEIYATRQIKKDNSKSTGCCES